MAESLDEWLRQYQEECSISTCAAGCRKLGMTYRWRNRKRYRKAQAQLLALMLADRAGPTILTYEDVAQEVAPGEWVKVPNAANSWVVPADVDLNVMMSNLDREAWIVYHVRSHKSVQPWRFPGDVPLKVVCESMTANEIDLVLIAFYDNDWFELYTAGVQGH
jgi:hypothetical protein